MASPSDDSAKLEIAHVLFMDIVGYSNLPMEEQRSTVQALTKLVRETETFRRAEAANNLIALPTGDGMALVFFEEPEAPLTCAVELSKSLREPQKPKLRMGVHSGAIYRIHDIKTGINVTGRGINLAARVMDCGDAGHIIASGAVADMLGQSNAWSGAFHELGEVVIKGGERIRVFNVYGEGYGNPEPPKQKEQTISTTSHERETRPRVSRSAFLSLLRPGTKAVWIGAVTTILLVLGAASIILFSGSRVRSLAVVPFALKNDNVEAAYLAKGLSESVSTSLLDLEKKLVIKRGNTKTYPWQFSQNNRSIFQELGKNLGAESLLCGTIEKTDENVVVEVELIDVNNGSKLWNQRYTKAFHEISDVEQDIAEQVTKKLSISLTEEEKASLRRGTSQNAEARTFYELGRSRLIHRDESNLRLASENFKDAVKKDAQFARAFAKLADALVLLNVYGTPTRDRMEEAEAAAKRALEVDKRLAEAYTSLAYVNFRYRWDWPTAEEQFRRALELNPVDAQTHDWYADFLEALNRPEEAIKQMQLAVNLSPNEIWINADLGLAYCYAGKYDAAIDQLRKTLNLANGNEDSKFAQTHNYLGLCYEQKEQPKDAFEHYQKAYQLDPNSIRLRAILGRGYALSGDLSTAQGILNELSKDEKILYYLVLLNAAIGKPENIEAAFKLLDRAIENREPAVVFLRIDPRLNNLREDRRFEELLKRLNL